MCKECDKKPYYLIPYIMRVIAGRNLSCPVNTCFKIFIS